MDRKLTDLALYRAGWGDNSIALDDALTTAITNQVATKADIEASRVEIEALRGDVMAEIKPLKWMGGVLLAFQIVVTGKLFFG